VKITVERRDEFLVAVPQIFDRVKSVALWSAKKKDHKGHIINVYSDVFKIRIYLVSGTVIRHSIIVYPEDA
jgi:hypothetical protein